MQTYFSRALACSVFAALLTGQTMPLKAPAVPVGWASGPSVADEYRYEQQLMKIPSGANAMDIENHISAVPHRATTQADYDTAMYVKQRLEKDGFKTRVKQYDVMFTGPLVEKLALVSPKPQAFDLLEGTPGHHTRWETMAGPPFMEESGDGDVTGPVVYVNSGSKADIETLDEQHISLKGAVVLMRLGAPGAGFLSSFDPTFNSYNELTKRGAVAILEFFEPATSGYGGGMMWPDGNYKNINMAERMGGSNPRAFMCCAPGDPTLPGKAPLPGVQHQSWNDIPHATIPELSITQNVARRLLAGMTGPTVPSEWHPMFEFVQHFGGNERVRVTTKFERKVKPIWLVIGDLQGSSDPTHVVMIGSHRDAMAYGAIDPGSGTTVLLQDADAFARLAKSGWKPKRTLEIVSWDGHELGLWGSAGLIYEEGQKLRDTVVQYINTDQLTTNDPFIVSASAGLFTFMKQICDVVPSRDGKTMLGQRSDKPRPLLNPIGGGSDHQNLAYMLGIPSTSNGYYGPFGAHHTAEDNIDGIKTYDPGMKEAVIAAQVTGIQAMRAANADVVPLRIGEIPDQLLKDLMPIQVMAFQASEGKVTLNDLRDALTTYRDAAHKADDAMAKAEAAGDLATMNALAAKEQASRNAFYMTDGTTFNPYYHTIDRVFVSFPEIIFAGKDKEKQAKAVERMMTAVKSATAALQ